MPEEKVRTEEEDTTADEAVQDQLEEEEPTPEQWREALEKTVAQRDEYLQMAQRSQAEFQNFKRRNAMARTDGYDDGVRETLALLLPTIDAVEIAIRAAKEGGENPMLEGLVLIHKQMMEALSKMGLSEVPALGEMFDPEYHNAVMRESGDDPGKVLEVFQKGYRVKERILRYAMVKVSVDDHE